MTTIEEAIGFFEVMLEYSDPPFELIDDQVFSYSAIELTMKDSRKVVGKNLRIERVLGLVMMDGFDANHGQTISVPLRDIKSVTTPGPKPFKSWAQKQREVYARRVERWKKEQPGFSEGIGFDPSYEWGPPSWMTEP